MTRYPLYFYPGDTENRVFQYLDSAGVVVDLTGYTATFTATVGTTTITLSGVVDGPNGKVQITVGGTDTTALGAAGSIGSYHVTVISGGTTDTTIATGPLVLLNL